MQTTLKRTASITLAILATVTLARAKPPSLTTTLAPTEIALGEATQLIVIIQGRSADAPQLPDVDGLEFQSVGQSSQLQVINGAMSANLEYTYLVTPTRPGTFTIPAIKVGRDTEIAASRPLVLQVGPSAGSAPARTRPNQNSLPAPTVTGNAESISAAEQRSFGFLRLVISKKEFFVGEMVPVELKAYFRDGVELRVDGPPKLNSDAFTMNRLGDQPVSSRQVIHGIRYAVYTWPTAITAVKAGDYAMSVEIPTTVTVRQPAQPSRLRRGNPFGDDFFDEVFSNFFGAATQKQISLSSELAEVKILTLPTENRPAGFAGAVGQFDFAAAAAPSQTQVGDPVTLTLKISGAGNFDRVTAPAVEKSEAWKTYKPSAKFAAGDTAGYSGTKHFEQALVPLRAGQLEIPLVAFSYFDPEQRRYITRTTDLANIAVAPSPSAATTATPSPSATTTPADASRADADVAPNKVASGPFTATLRPWFTNPWLAVGALLPSVLALVAYGRLLRRPVFTREPQADGVANARRALRLQLETMNRATGYGDSGNFFAAACAAFQIRLGLRWRLPPRTITLAEINARLNGKADGLRHIFGLADEAIYSGRAFAPDELRQLQTLVDQELKKLEAL